MSLNHNWIIKNANLAPCTEAQVEPHTQREAWVAIERGKIIFIGSEQQWFNHGGSTGNFQTIDANGRWLTPGFIDCHTHLVFGGNRAQEFAQRLEGASYEQIAKRGGGILSSVKQTRAATEQQLFEQSAARLERLLEEGVTTVEIKSGYGLDIATELKMLRVAKALDKAYPVKVRTTFLGAHAVAPEFAAQADAKQAYIDFVCKDMLPAIADQQLADAVDVFCEGIGFSVAQCTQVYAAAHKLGLPIKAHAEQLSDLKGAVAAAQHNALSVDHLEYLLAQDVSALKGTVAVLLPAAFYYLNETQLPPVQALRDHDIAMAVATDLNPGTAPVASLLTAMNQACVLFGLTTQETLQGVTCNAAKALALPTKGQIAIDFDADLALWDIQHPADLSYGINLHRPALIWQAGQLVGGSNKNYNSR